MHRPKQLLGTELRETRLGLAGLSRSRRSYTGLGNGRRLRTIHSVLSPKGTSSEPTAKMAAGLGRTASETLRVMSPVAATIWAVVFDAVSVAGSFASRAGFRSEKPTRSKRGEATKGVDNKTPAANATKIFAPRK